MELYGSNDPYQRQLKSPRKSRQPSGGLMCTQTWFSSIIDRAHIYECSEPFNSTPLAGHAAVQWGDTAVWPLLVDGTVAAKHMLVRKRWLLGLGNGLVVRLSGVYVRVCVGGNEWYLAGGWDLSDMRTGRVLIRAAGFSSCLPICLSTPRSEQRLHTAPHTKEYRQLHCLKYILDCFYTRYTSTLYTFCIVWHSCFSFSLQGFVTLTRAQPPQRIAANPPPQVKHPSEQTQSIPPPATIIPISPDTGVCWNTDVMSSTGGGILTFQLIPLHRTKVIVHLKMTIVIIYS